MACPCSCWRPQPIRAAACGAPPHLRPHSLSGLYEKIFLAIELLWLWLVAWPISAHGQGNARPLPRNAASTLRYH